MDAQPIQWQHIAIEGACYLAPTLGALYLGFKKLMWILGEYRPHRHDEDKEDAHPDTQLTVDGITYPRQFNGH